MGVLLRGAHGRLAATRRVTRGVGHRARARQLAVLHDVVLVADGLAVQVALQDPEGVLRVCTREVRCWGDGGMACVSGVHRADIYV